MEKSIETHLAQVAYGATSLMLLKVLKKINLPIRNREPRGKSMKRLPSSQLMRFKESYEKAEKAPCLLYTKLNMKTAYSTNHYSNHSITAAADVI